MILSDDQLDAITRRELQDVVAAWRAPRPAAAPAARRAARRGRRIRVSVACGLTAAAMLVLGLQLPLSSTQERPVQTSTDTVQAPATVSQGEGPEMRVSIRGAARAAAW